MNAELIEIRLEGEFSGKNHGYLFLCYKPLIGSKAASLYEVLLAVADTRREITRQELLILTGFSEALLEQARIELEKFNLLKNLLDETSGRRIFKLFPCKNYSQFLQDDIYARMIINDLSAKQYETIREFFVEEDPEERLVDQSAVLDLNDLEAKWSWTNENFFMKKRGIHEKGSMNDFDWKVFFMGQGRTFPKRMRIQSNMDEIVRLADFYGVDEEGIRPFVLRAMNKNKTQIDFSKLEKALIYSTKGQASKTNDRYQESPVFFLQENSPGGKVLSTEKKLLKQIMNEYGFSNEVVNTLVEYSMKACDGQFIDGYIRRLANNWGRIGIKNRKDALAWMKKNDESSRKGTREKPAAVLPDWYTEVPAQELTPETWNEAQRLLSLLEEDEQNRR